MIEENDEVAREDDAIYTYYQLDLENISVDWDFTICESLDHVRQTLEYLDVHLDDDSETANGQPRRVVITGIPMTPSAYREFIEDNEVPESQRAKRKVVSAVMQWVDCNERVPYSGCYHVTIEDGDKNVSGAYIERFLGMWALPDEMDGEGDLRVTKWLEEIAV